MQLTERKLEELSSSLKYKIYTCPFEKQSQLEAIVVAFYGKYGFGSAGNGDATFMTAIIMAALAGWEPSGLVIDLRQMKYEWGDLIVKAIDAGANRYINAPFPTAIVISDLNREGLTSLVSDEMDEEPSKWLFESLETAMREVEKQYEEMVRG